MGGVYAWSLFVPMMKTQLGFSTAQTQLMIGMTLAVFALSMLITGKLEKKYGSRTLGLLSGFFMFSGYLLAGFSGGKFWPMCLSISIFAGIATGCGYVAGLIVPAKNYPNHRGLVVGISAAGFGGGAIILTYLVKYLISIQPDIGVLELFKFVGLLYGFIYAISFYFLQYDGSGKSTENLSLFKSSISFANPKFLILFFTMFSGAFAGLLVLSNLKPMVLSFGFSESVATFAISLYAIGNMLGRVFWGYTADKIGAIRSTISAFLVLLFFVLMLNMLPHTEIYIALTLVGIGLGYSSLFVLLPMLTTKVFGLDQFGTVYPYIFIAYGLAAITGPYLAGYIFDLNKSYSIAVLLSSALGASALAVFWFNRNRI